MYINALYVDDAHIIYNWEINDNYYGNDHRSDHNLAITFANQNLSNSLI